MVEGTAIRCDDCDRHKKLAEITPDSGLAIINGHSGNVHHSIVEPKELIEALAGTRGTGAVEYVKRLFGG